jgi:hypothetical protein
MSTIRKWTAIATLFCFSLAPCGVPAPATRQSQAALPTVLTAASAPQKSRAGATRRSSKRKSKPHSYTNRSGQRVQSPTHSNSIPAGARAQCQDGSFSFSRNRRGTCSHHGGVSQWLNR